MKVKHRFRKYLACELLIIADKLYTFGARDSSLKFKNWILNTFSVKS